METSIKKIKGLLRYQAKKLKMNWMKFESNSHTKRNSIQCEIPRD